jgi:hypothetical protein
MSSRFPTMEAGRMAPTAALMAATAVAVMTMSTARVAVMAVGMAVTTMTVGRVAVSVMTESTISAAVSPSAKALAITVAAVLLDVTAMTSTLSATGERMARTMMRTAKAGMMAALTVLAVTRPAMRGETVLRARAPLMTEPMTRRAAVSVTPAGGAPVAATMSAAAPVFVASDVRFRSMRSARPTCSASLRPPIASSVRAAPRETTARRSRWATAFRPSRRWGLTRLARLFRGSRLAGGATRGTETRTSAAPRRSTSSSRCGRRSRTITARLSRRTTARRTATPLAFVLPRFFILLFDNLSPGAIVPAAPAVPVGEAAKPARPIALEARVPRAAARTRLFGAQPRCQQQGRPDSQKDTIFVHAFLP